MKSLLLTYDNHVPRDYGRLYSLMIRLGAVRLAESVWLIRSTATAWDICLEVSAAMDPADKVAVVELKAGSGWTTIRASDEGNRWLAANLLPLNRAA